LFSERRDGCCFLSAAQVPEVRVKDSNSDKHNSPEVKPFGDVTKSEVNYANERAPVYRRGNITT